MIDQLEEFRKTCSVRLVYWWPWTRPTSKYFLAWQHIKITFEEKNTHTCSSLLKHHIGLNITWPCLEYDYSPSTCYLRKMSFYRKPFTLIIWGGFPRCYYCKAGSYQRDASLVTLPKLPNTKCFLSVFSPFSNQSECSWCRLWNPREKDLPFVILDYKNHRLNLTAVTLGCLISLCFIYAANALGDLQS